MLLTLEHFIRKPSKKEKKNIVMLTKVLEYPLLFFVILCVSISFGINFIVGKVVLNDSTLHRTVLLQF